MDGVSVLHTRPRVKRKARDDFGRGSGGARCDTPGVAIAAEVRGSYGPLLEPSEVMSRAAKVAITWQSRTPARLYSCDTLLERLAPDLEHMTAKPRPFIQEEDAVVGQVQNAIRVHIEGKGHGAAGPLRPWHRVLKHV